MNPALKAKITKGDFDKYREYWSSKRDTIDDISCSLGNRLVELEKRTNDIDSVYIELESIVASLSSIYSASKEIYGQEFLLKLNAHLRNHRESLDKHKVAFNVIHFIYDKINELRDESFRNFPDMPRDYREKPVVYRNPVRYSEPMQFKYISFERNGSFFITRYSSAEVVPYRIVPFAADVPGERNVIEYKENRLDVVDIFAVSASSPPPDPACYLIVSNNETRCFAADRVIRRYLSPKDFLSSKVKPFRRENKIADGFVTLGGKKHIMLKAATL